MGESDIARLVGMGTAPGRGSGSSVMIDDGEWMALENSRTDAGSSFVVVQGGWIGRQRLVVVVVEVGIGCGGVCCGGVRCGMAGVMSNIQRCSRCGGIQRAGMGAGALGTGAKRYVYM
ncbi:hypothetical protein BDN70DRAFT_492930 [Pholiota conissans]|uniref:Uncharacterized protein n=1 Tax=Pholiota conissans TaxID=109636 RepID=A0A9P5Z860_9AGAR|nr:hypothetical protein BDN70DRAFT_492930 [Pholiota conissans]